MAIAVINRHNATLAAENRRLTHFSGSTLNERSVILTSLGYPPYGVQQAKFQINYRPGTTQGMI